MNIEEARQRLPLPDLMAKLGLGDYAKSKSKSPFRDEKNASFGIYHTNGRWRWKDHGTGEGGDEIDFLAKLENKSNHDAMLAYAELAGMPIHEKRPEPARFKLKTSTPTTSDWSKYKAAATDEFLHKLSEQRGVSFNIMKTARDNDILGASGDQPAFKSGDGAHVKCAGGGWRFEPKGTQNVPLVFGDQNSKNVYFFESQWDLLAIADMIGESWNTVLWVASRGASNGKCIEAFAEDRKVYAFPQNDTPKKDGKIPSEAWMQDAASVCKNILRVRTPSKFGDANDWIRSKETNRREVIAAIKNATDPAMVGVEMHSFEELFSFVPKEDNTTLLGDRWVCQGGQLLIVGQSGVGKSSLTVQAAMFWALGMPFFGIKPRRELKSLFIQAENDTGDMAEIVQGVMSYVVANCGLPQAQAVSKLTENITFARVTSQTGADFIDVVGRLLDKKGDCDLVFGDPLLSYIGDDISQQSVASSFLRGLCNPIAFQRKFAWVWSHHTGKPQGDSKSRAHWNTNDFAYVGLGSSELTNWARAICVLQTTKEDGTFRLLLAKRGRRAGVVDEIGDSTTQIGLRHGQVGLYWEPCALPTEEQGSKEKGKPGAPSALSEVEKQEAIAFISCFPENEQLRTSTMQACKDRFKLKCHIETIKNVWKTHKTEAAKK
jgi:hypothetical protein